MQVLAHVARALLLLIALAAVGTAAVWRWRPEWVDWLDEAATYRYTAAPRERLDAIRARMVDDAAGEVAALRTLTRDLAGHRKGDRRFGTRQEALQSYAIALRADERHDEAHAVADELVALDDRNLRYGLWRAEFFYRLPQSRARAFEAYAALSERLPELGMVVSAHAAALDDAGRGEERVRLVARHLARTEKWDASMTSLLSPWVVHWTHGTGFAADRRVTATPQVVNQRFVLDFELPAGTRRVRVDAPRRSLVALSRPTIVYAVGDETVPDVLDVDALELKEMRVAGEVLHAEGGRDPFFVTEVPEGLPNEELRCRLVALLDHAPSWVVDAALDPAALEVLRELAVEDPDGASARLMEARIDGLAASPVTVRAGGGVEASDALGDVEGAHVRVDAALELDAPAGAVTVELPPVRGAAYQIARLVATVDGAEREVDTASSETRDLERGRNDVLTATGPRPSLSFDLGAPGARLTRIRLEGRAR